MALTRKWYPDFAHHASPVQLSLPKVSSSRPAWSDDSALGLCGSGPSAARSGAKLLLGYVTEYVISATFTVRMLPTALASLAAILERSKLGIAMAATIITAPKS